MTKTEYAEYLQSPEWKELRRQVFLEMGSRCAHCHIPRWLAEIVYDQDLHVHHKTYVNIGNEALEDLEPICRRCHDIETFGRTDLKAPKATGCTCCGSIHWDVRSPLCSSCECLSGNTPDLYFKLRSFNPESGEHLCMVVMREIDSLVEEAKASQKNG